MSRLKGSKNKKPSEISYPRKCESCNYFSNNPSMYHYHAKTHQSITNGKLCDNGCGNPAAFINTNGRSICSPVTQHCPKYAAEHSARVKEQWINDADRKTQTRQSFISRLHNKETYEKISKLKREKTKIISPETAKEYRHYARKIRTNAQKWAKEQGYKLGKQTYHVDHKLSILDAWNAGLPEYIVNHPANLQVIEAKVNSIKGAKSIFTVEELILICEQFNGIS